MKKSIWIFLLAVFLPSAILGWLALRSAGEQQIVLERRTAELYQKETENAASAVRALVDEERRSFNEAVRRLLASKGAQSVAADFSTALSQSWPRPAIGFAIGRDGRLISPNPQRAQSNPAWQKFLLGNRSFLDGTAPANVYWVSGEELAKPEPLRVKGKTGWENSQSLALADKTMSQSQIGNSRSADDSKDRAKSVLGGMKKTESAAQLDQAEKAVPPPASAPAPLAKAMPAKPKQASQSEGFELKSARKPDTTTAPEPQAAPAPPGAAPAAAAAAPAQAKEQSPNDQGDFAYNKDINVLRNVAPQRMFNDNEQAAVSQLNTAIADFSMLTRDTDEGVITRFVQDKLEIIFWLRPAQTPEMIFGCLLDADSLRSLWPAALPSIAPSSSYDRLTRSAAPDYILALLDDKTRPVVTQPAATVGREWKRPFVASEVGEALPHWEIALYLQRPEQFQESARAVRRMLILLIAAALTAIAAGGWVVFADARRQLALAQKKTDFVSNVSHELKTPLTSIRMFAELMQNGRGESAARHPQYLRIIMVEAERLTRLINNVLDFARLERKQKRFDRKPLDLHAVIERTWEGHELHLQESGFSTRWEAAPGPYPVVGDDDALAQILVNLLSNAEKYSSERKEVELHTYIDAGHICVSVLDRGLGVPPGEEKKIFESFYRAHDSLSSGIQGSGLGLTLAQHLAHEHGGEILYQPRSGGGSNFTLRLPRTDENHSVPPALPS